MGKKLKITKKIISIILVLTIVVGLFSGCTKSLFDSYITRGEWISALSERMGMAQYQEKNSYFKDVKENEPIFPCVQACYEWNVLSAEDGPYFYSDFKADRAFVAKTIVKASTILDNTKATDDEIFEAALNNHILNSLSEKRKRIKREDLEEYLEKAYQLYKNKEFVEYNNSKLVDSAVLLGADDFDELDTNRYIVSGVNLSTDNTILLPANDENPAGIAKKVTDINGDIITTEDAVLEDIYEKFAFAKTLTPDINDLVLAPGVSINENGEIDVDNVLMHLSAQQPTASFLGNTKPKAKEMASIGNFGFDFDFTEGAPSLNPSFNLGDKELKASLSDKKSFNQGAFEKCGKLFEDKTTFTFQNLPNFSSVNPETGKTENVTEEGWEKSLSGGGKLTGGHEWKGSFSLDDIEVNTELQLAKFFGIPYGIDYFKAELKETTVFKTTFKGNVDHEIQIATWPIPIGFPGITVNLNFYLLLSAEGILTLSINWGNRFICEYSNGNFRNTKETLSDECSAEAAIDIKFGPAFGVSINAFSIEIIDFRTDLYAMLEVKAKAAYEVNKDTEKHTKHEKGYISLEGKIYCPIITLEIGTENTLAKKIGLTLKMDLISKEDAPIQLELFKQEWVLFEEDSQLEEEETTQLQEGEQNADAYTNFDISDYAITLGVGESKQLGVTLPNDFSMSDVRFSSADTSIAEVDEQGNITAVAVGSTSVSVELDGKRLECAVFVTDN